MPTAAMTASAVATGASVDACPEIPAMVPTREGRFSFMIDPSNQSRAGRWKPAGHGRS